LELTDDDIDGYLDLFDRWDLIARYEVKNDRLIQIVKWQKHQRPHPREVQSMLPPMPANVRQAREQNPRQTEGSPKAEHLMKLQSGSSGSSGSSEVNLKTKGTNDDSRQTRAHAYTRGGVSSSPPVVDEVVADLREHGVQRVTAARDSITLAVTSGATLALFAEAREVGASRKGDAPVTANFVLGIVRNWLAEGHTPKALNGHGPPQGEFYRDRLARKAHGLTTVSSESPVIEATEVGHVRKPA
jgi:hypothetical protein